MFFKDKDPGEEMEYLNLLAENAQIWDTIGTYEAPSKTQPHITSGGMCNFREDHDLQAKFASLAS
jgi:hypothetical protein